MLFLKNIKCNGNSLTIIDQNLAISGYEGPD
jgi:hypothetical protein